MSDQGPLKLPPDAMRIQDAPSRIRLQWMLTERRNGRIAIAVIIVVLSAVGWGLFQFARWLWG